VKDNFSGDLKALSQVNFFPNRYFLNVNGDRKKQFKGLV